MPKTPVFRRLSSTPEKRETKKNIQHVKIIFIATLNCGFYG